MAGRLTHRFGPKVSVATAQFLQGVGASILLIAGNAVAVFVAAALMACGLQLFYCSVFVLIADASTDETKERPFALVGMIRGAAFGLGNLLAALTLAYGDYRNLRWLVAADAVTFGLAAFLLVRYVVTRPVRHDQLRMVGPTAVLRDRPYLALMVAMCLIDLTIDFALVGTPVFLLNVLSGPAWLPGGLLAAGTLLSSVFGVKVVDALRGYRRTRSLQAAGLLYAGFGVALMTLVWIPGAWLVPYACAAWLLLVVANKILYPLAGALSEAMPPRAARAGYMATFQYAFTTAQVLAPAVVALFAITAWLPWAVIAASALVGVLTLQWLAGVLSAETDRPRHLDHAPA